MDFSREWKYLQQVSKKRLHNNKTGRHVSRYGEEIELIGAAGELAARRFLGIPQSLHEVFDGGVDLIWKGKTVDVKATQLTPKIMHRYWQWPEWKDIRADIILMTAVNLKEKQAAVLGYVYAQELKDAPINLERHFPCHEIPVPLLHPAYLLIAPGKL
jgi:hypothetical protein